MTDELDDQPDAAYQIGRLASDEPQVRARMLAAIAENPLPDPDLLAACERLLEDRTLTVLGLPYRFGEVRWAAADAVAAVRGMLSITEPVMVEDVVPPCSTDDVARMAAAAGLPAMMGGVAGVLATLRTLADADRVLRRTITRSAVTNPVGRLPLALTSRDDTP